MASTLLQIIRRVDRLGESVLAALDRLQDLRSTAPGDRAEAGLWLLGNAAQIDAEGRRVVRDLVTVARRSGATWEDVGRSFGTTKQSAWERFR